MLHPFWKGAFEEFQKEGILGVNPETAAQYAIEHPILAGGAALATAALGAGAITGAARGARKLLGGRPAAAAAAPALKPGFSGKAMLATGAAGVAGGYILGKRRRDQ